MSKKIIIDAGHGGNDSGASGNGIIEKDYTLNISKYINDRLNSLGVDSKLTRNTDETLAQNERINRIKTLFPLDNNLIIISNHLNAGGGDGAEIIYSLKNNDTLSKMLAKEFESNGQNVRKYYQRRLPSNPSKDYYYIMRDTGNAEAVIVEYGFLDSNKDDVNQIKNNWKKYAEGVVKAIVDYIGISYSVTDVTYDNKYIVKSGDSLWSIGKKYGVSVDDLKKVNGLSSNLIQIGQKLIIPGKEENNTSDIYIVKKGDSLWSIAQKYNLSVKELKELNNLKTDIIQPNQVLKINLGNNIYVVKSGDNLYNIAKKYNTTVTKLISVNNLKSDILQIGQKLIIPK